MVVSQGRLLVLATLLALACRWEDPAATLRPAYPDLLHQARVEGILRFRIGLDSAGSPDLAQFRVLSSPNLGFDLAVRRAVAVWRPLVPRGTAAVEHSVLFLILPGDADSVRDCPRAPGYTVVCALEPRVTTLYRVSQLSRRLTSGWS